MKKYLIILGLLFCTGCGVVNGVGSYINKDKFRQLEVGMSKEQLTAIMGKPNMSKVRDSDEWWFYRTDGVLTAYNPKDYTPVCLVDGKVTGWGRKHYKERTKKTWGSDS
jgi:outer membrane protein assembly factor BamE (lipoprotein component of BamABCDE complex)